MSFATDSALHLVLARDTRQPVAKLTSARPLRIDEAYEVQRAFVARLLDLGEVPVGLKLGFTSVAKARQMGIDEPIAAILTDRMAVPNGAPVATDDLIHPRIEPEIALRIDLRGGGALSVAPAMEIIDSRFTDFDFEAADVVADNASAAHFVTGAWRVVDDGSSWDWLRDAAVTLCEDDLLVAQGRTSAILGDPLAAVRVAQELSDRHRLAAPPEAILMAGAATAAVPFVKGRRYSTNIEGLGEVSVLAR